MWGLVAHISDTMDIISNLVITAMVLTKTKQM
jgi:hypothetical protein